MTSLLEKLEDYEGLAEALEARAKLEAPDEAALTLAQLGKLRMEYLGDARAALSAFSQALRADPQNEDSRSALEQLVVVSGLELAAAQVLEPLYRAEGNAAGLVQMLLARAQASADASERLAALSEAVTVAETQLGDVSLALDLAGQALELVARE